MVALAAAAILVVVVQLLLVAVVAVVAVVLETQHEFHLERNSHNTRKKQGSEALCKSKCTGMLIAKPLRKHDYIQYCQYLQDCEATQPCTGKLSASILNSIR